MVDGRWRMADLVERAAEAGRVGNGPLGCAAVCPPIQTSAITDQPFTPTPESRACGVV